MAQYEPIYTKDINDVDEYCTKRIQQGYCGAWFNGITRTKVDAVDCESIDGLSALHPTGKSLLKRMEPKRNGLRHQNIRNLLSQVKQRRL